MKKLNHLGWLAAIVLLAAGCNDDDPPAPKPDLQTVIAGKYWCSTPSFRYLKDGAEVVDTEISLPELLAAQGELNENRPFLGVFFCGDGGSSIDAYRVTPYDPEGDHLLVYRGIYTLRLNAEQTVVRLTANDAEFAERSIYTDTELRLVSYSEERVEFDLNLNENVRRQWAKTLQDASITITGIRDVWTPVTESQRSKYHDFESPLVMFPKN